MVIVVLIIESNINKLITIQEILKRSINNPSINFNNSICWENKENNDTRENKSVSSLKSSFLIDDSIRDGNFSVFKAIQNFDRTKDKLNPNSIGNVINKEDSLKKIEEIIEEFFTL